ncbi:MAG: diguanylate cyclase/phosphodiesterase, partial [Rhizobacter sp.]|nr:diguanylate cyclase/phosphodiesterase [Rhizobacter sp.]
MNSSLHYLDAVRNAWLLVGIVLIAAGAAALGLRLLARARRAADKLEAALLAAKSRLLAAEAALEQRSVVDPLPGFIDRQTFEARLREAVARCDAPDGSLAHRPQWLAVLRIDLDGFRWVNDSLGHDIGDRLLKEMAQRLVPLLNGSDVAARVGSDEFLVLLEQPAQSQLDGSRAVAQTIAVLSKPLRPADGTTPVTVSIGVSVYPDHGPIDKLLARADAALQRARKAGGARCKVFEPNMDDDASDQLTLRNDLRAAVDGGQLELVYQPKVDAQRGKVTGVEGLLRWNHPQRGVLGPALFVPLAERFGLIGEIGQWV